MWFKIFKIWNSRNIDDRLLSRSIGSHGWQISIGQLNKKHNAPVPYPGPTIHHFVTEMCTCVHIFVTKWCIVGYLSNALSDLVDGVHWMSCGCGLVSLGIKLLPGQMVAKLQENIYIVTGTQWVNSTYYQHGWDQIHTLTRPTLSADKPSATLDP